MSKNIDDILKEVVKSNKEIHTIDNNISKDMAEIKKYIKTIDIKIKHLESKIDEAISILNTFTILITEGDEEDLDHEEYIDSENSEWNPYEVSEDYESDDYGDDEEEDE